MNEEGGARRGRSRGLNRIQILGNLGRDPELRFTQSGTPVANFTVAVNETWQRKDGQPGERTEWFRVVAWGRLAEIANEYLRRGRQVFIEGRIQTREWQDREGNDRTSTELVARDLLLLGSRDGVPGEHDDQAPQPPQQDDQLDDELTPEDLPF